LHRIRTLILGSASHPVQLDPNSLAIQRTRLSHERTLMSWIRTGLSLISFGFAVFSFFKLQAQGEPFREGLITPRSFGFLMVLTGLVAILLAGLQHFREMESFRAAGIHVPPSLATIVGILVVIIGFLALIGVIFG
jgi:putative membrane protein